MQFCPRLVFKTWCCLVLILAGRVSPTAAQPPVSSPGGSGPLPAARRQPFDDPAPRPADAPEQDDVQARLRAAEDELGQLKRALQRGGGIGGIITNVDPNSFDPHRALDIEERLERLES